MAETCGRLSSIDKVVFRIDLHYSFYSQYLEIPRKIPNVPLNIAVIFVRKLAIVDHILAPPSASYLPIPRFHR
jgi:hypothetical protein